MEFKKISILFILSLLIHMQIEAVDLLNQVSLSSVDLKRHNLTVETTSFLADFARRQLAGGGGSSGGSRGGGSSSGGGSRGSGGSSGGGGGRGGGSGSRGGGNKGGGGGGGGRGDDGDEGDSGGGGGGGNSGNSRPTPTSQGRGQTGTVFPNGQGSSGGAHLQYSLGLVIVMACLVIMYY